MKIAIVTISYNQHVGLRKLFASARTKEPLSFFLFRHSTIPATVAACDEVSRNYPTFYFAHGTNRGVARSWNDGILAAADWGADVTIVCNDDIVFGEGDVDKISRAAMDNRDRFVVFAAGKNTRLRRAVSDQGMACYAINPIAIERIGMFDENFFPAYCEDCDYCYRAKMLGLKRFVVGNTSIVHTGSASIYSSSELRAQNARTHSLNDRYYIRKWGDKPEREKFKRPFNSPNLDWYISPEARHAPYPGRNRNDL